jgi:hypothetical protein
MYVLTPTYFSFYVKFYEQSGGIATVSSLSPVISDVFMEDFEYMILSQATLKLLLFTSHRRLRRPDGSLGRKFYRKPTHTSLYQNHGSHHHNSKKQAVLATLSHRARLLCDKESLHSESKSFKTTSLENGYRLKLTSRAHDQTVRTPKPKEKPTSVAILPYIKTTYGRLKRMLGR